MKPGTSAADRGPAGRRRFGPPWPEEPGRREIVSPGLFDCLRGLVRITAAAAFLGGLWVLAAAGEAGANPAIREARSLRLRKQGARILLALLGVRPVFSGRPHPGPCLVAGNHRSWLDSILVAAATGASYTAYSRDNRVIDSFLSAMGTILLPRGYSASLPGMVAAAAGILRRGTPVGVFPEGTTTFGPACLPFKPAFFQAALDAEAPVQPFALEYRTFRPWPSAPRAVHWVDWTPLPVHVYRVLCLPRIEALLSWLPVVAAREEERGSLAARTEGVVREGLARPAP